MAGHSNNQIHPELAYGGDLALVEGDREARRRMEQAGIRRSADV